MRSPTAVLVVLALSVLIGASALVLPVAVSPAPVHGAAFAPGPALTASPAPGTPAGAGLPAAVGAASPARAVLPSRAPEAAPPTAKVGVAGWNSSSFFQDVQVNFYGTGLPLGFRTVPYVNALSETEYGFWVNLTAAAPILFANLTIWGTQWPGSNLSQPISGFGPNAPAVEPFVVNASDPAQASFFVDNYRYFWPGSSVFFNISVVGENSTPSEVTSAGELSVVENYPGGYQDAATWAYTVASPWASENFSNDIAIATTPNVIGPIVFDPNPDQSVSVTISSISVSGVTTPIPAAVLEFTVDLNGTVSAYSVPFGPLNHDQMTTTQSIGPYPGGSVSFNVTAWLPWEGGAIDRLTSPQYSFAWSKHGGWWDPLGTLSENAVLETTPTLSAYSTASSPSTSTLPTDQPVRVAIHEPIENVTIASAVLIYDYSLDGAGSSGSIAMSAISGNTSVVTLPGLPDGATLTFYLVAKDIYGNAIASGNYSYIEVGPTNPPLPADRGLLYVQLLDVSNSTYLSDFTYSVSNGAWAENGTTNGLGFAQPLLPGSSVPVQLPFGTYSVAVDVRGTVQSAVVTLSPSSPTPVVNFLVESGGTPAAPSLSSATVVPYFAMGGLVGAALATLPLLQWFEQRRAEAEEEQRRITL